MKNKTKSWLNILAFISVIAVNYLSVTGLFNNLTQKDVSEMFPTLITPATFAFSIWGVIYLLVFISLGVMIFRNKEKEYDEAIQAFSILFWISCLANILWNITFLYLNLVLSSVMIFILLISLTEIIRKISKIDSLPKLLLPLTFGMYAGWVLIATVINFSATLVQMKWAGFGLDVQVWTNIILAVSLIIVLFVTFKTKNAILVVPVAWGYFAIYKEHAHLVSLIGIFVLAGIGIFQFIQNRNQIQGLEKYHSSTKY